MRRPPDAGEAPRDGRPTDTLHAADQDDTAKATAGVCADEWSESRLPRDVVEVRHDLVLPRDTKAAAVALAEQLGGKVHAWRWATALLEAAR